VKFIKSIEIFDRKVFNIIMNYTFLTNKILVNFDRRNSRLWTTKMLLLYCDPLLLSWSIIVFIQDIFTMLKNNKGSLDLIPNLIVTC
jgi:hypothetical protein